MGKTISLASIIKFLESCHPLFGCLARQDARWGARPSAHRRERATSRLDNARAAVDYSHFMSVLFF